MNPPPNPKIRFLIETFSLALLYVVGARLGFLFAIPASNVTLVRVSSGLAVAGFLLLGPRAAMGVWIGSFAANLWQLSGGAPWDRALIVSASIALASTLQALAILHLTRRWTGGSLQAFTSNNVLKFFLGISPLACLIAATVGATSLSLAGLLPASTYAFTWGTWWLGDWLGIVVSAPLCAAAGARLLRQKLDQAALAAAIGLGAGMSLCFFAVSWRLEMQSLSADFEAESRAQQLAVEQTLELTLHDLEGVEALFAASNAVERDDFRLFVQATLTGEHATAGLQAISWDAYVPAEARAAYEAAIRREGFLDFQFTERNAQGQLIPAADRADYVIVVFIEPLAANRAALGNNANSDPLQRAAIVRARDTGQAAMTAPITLVQETAQQKAFWIFFPIYRKGTPTDSLVARRVNLQGYAVVAIRAGDVIEASLMSLDLARHDLYVFDMDSPAGEQLLYFHPSHLRTGPAAADPGLAPSDLQTGLYHQTAIEIAGRRWRMVTTPAPGVIAARLSASPWFVLVLGLTVSGLAVTYMINRQRAEAELLEIDTRLRESETRFRTLAETTSAAIYIQRGSHLLYTNPATTDITGYSPDELRQISLPDIASPDFQKSVYEQLHSRLPGLAGMERREIKFITRNGEERWLDAIACPYEYEDQPARLVTAFDITDRKRAQEALQTERANLDAIFESSPVGMIVLDQTTNVVMANAALLRLAQAPASEVEQHRPGNALRCVHSSTDPRGCGYSAECRICPVRNALEGLLASGGTVHDVELPLQLMRGGEPRTVWVNIGIEPVLVGGLRHLCVAMEDITERKRLEHNVGERVKELRAFYHLSALAENPATMLDGLYQEMADVLPQSWQYPEVTCARIVISDRQFRSSNFAESRWYQTQMIRVEGSAVGRLDVGYLEEKPEEDEGPFLKEERQLIDAIAERIGRVTERKQAQFALARRLKEMTCLTEVGYTLSQPLAPDEVYRQVTTSLARAMQFPELAVGVMEVDHQRFASSPDDEAGAEGLHTDIVVRDRQAGRLSVFYREEKPFLLPFEQNLVDGLADALSPWLERNLTAEALRESEEHFRDLYENAPNAYFSIGIDGHIRRCNRRAGELLGYSTESLIGRAVLDLYADTPHGKAKARQVFQRFRSGETIKDEEMEMQMADGSHFWVSLTVNAVRDAEGHIVESRSVAVDITERKRAERTVQLQLERMNALRNIDQVIISSFDVRLTLNVLLEQVVSQLSVDAATILLFNPHTQTLEFAAGRGFRSYAFQHAQLRLGEGHAGRAALEHHTVHVPNLIEADDDLTRALTLVHESFVAYYGVPLIAKGVVKGVLEIFHRTPLSPDPEWLEFLETLAVQAAIAIDDAQLFDGLQRSNAELILAYDATIEGWSRAMDLRDKETEGHTQRVTEMTVELARAANISSEQIAHIWRGAMLHDMGKLGVPDSILSKPGKLTDEEWAIMREHAQYAYDMLSSIRYLQPALDIPYCHHEKWDGTGYPRGLKGEQIPLAARLFAVVDVWDALRSDRLYRPGWPQDKVMEHIQAQSGTHFDPQAVELFFQVMSEKAFEHKQGGGPTPA